MRQIKGKDVVVQDQELLRREKENRDYLLSLKSEHLLFNYYLEAGRYTGRGIETEIMGGWEAPTCQLRGHFLGHWLSAAAIHYDETGDQELKAKIDGIIRELGICQNENGGEWVAPIPEKYLYWIAKGKAVWAPQYNIHKLFMGLVDVYRLTGNEQALEIADRFADWFLRWSASYTKEEFDNILDVETGGMLEVWADLYEITKKEKYKHLMKRYYRSRLFEPLLTGKDALTNMHANTTIPEALGCARAYEVTKEQKWLDCVVAYWNCAVEQRGYFATRGQTQGEIWTPMKRLKARLGDKNQEHCTVYNMIRLAEFLFRTTKNPKYMHYIEYNIKNGIFAQTYWRGMPYGNSKDHGLITYFLPLKAGSKKDWAGEMDSFFCCHGTMVQANAALNRLSYYQDSNRIYITMYSDSKAHFNVNGQDVTIEQKEDPLNGNLQKSSVNNGIQTVNDVASTYGNKPDFKKYLFKIHTEESVEFTINLRIPDWIRSEAEVYLNDEYLKKQNDTDAFLSISNEWKDGDVITLILPIGLSFVPLPDDNSMGAFCYGSDVLAGICEQERILFIESDKPEDELSVDTERQWGVFQTFYRTENQDPGISFKKLNEVGYEPYQVYFKVKRRR